MTLHKAEHVVVRMYNVGFGDSFLLFIPTPDGTRKMLFDCGVHFQSKKPRPIQEVAEQIVEDARDSDGVSRIDVVVITHRHQDHVKGFESPVWDEVEVKEVWMPWTENPKDSLGREILEKQSGNAKSLHSATQKLLATSGAKDKERLEQMNALAMNSLTNEKAMLTVHEGFAGKPKRVFLPFAKREKNTFTREFLPGVKIHAMGPSRDPEVIRDMDPPDEETYRHLEFAATGDSTKGHMPFRSLWKLDQAEHLNMVGQLRLSKKDLEKLHSMSDEDAWGMAVALEKAVNGTSLLLMLQIGEAYMLFPGDAQWGTWNAAMLDKEWSRLLAKTTFYKIGHHGSHNATPKSFVSKLLPKDFWAMACTGPTTNWTDTIPLPGLMDDLRVHSPKVIRSDKPDNTGAEDYFERDSQNFFVDAKIPIS